MTPVIRQYVLSLLVTEGSDEFWEGLSEKSDLAAMRELGRAVTEVLNNSGLENVEVTPIKVFEEPVLKARRRRRRG